MDHKNIFCQTFSDCTQQRPCWCWSHWIWALVCCGVTGMSPGKITPIVIRCHNYSYLTGTPGLGARADRAGSWVADRARGWDRADSRRTLTTTSRRWRPGAGSAARGSGRRGPCAALTTGTMTAPVHWDRCHVAWSGGKVRRNAWHLISDF